MTAQNPDGEDENAESAWRGEAFRKENREKDESVGKFRPSSDPQSSNVENDGRESAPARERFSVVEWQAKYVARGRSIARKLVPIVFGRPVTVARSTLNALITRPLTTLIQARSTVREALLVVSAGLAAVTLSALAAFGISNWFGDIQIEVPDIVMTLGGRPSYVTTMAWTAEDGGPLAVGTADGLLVNVRRDGTLIRPSGDSSHRYAPGRIVEIIPSDTGVASEAVWGSLNGGYAGYMLRMEASYRGFTFRAGGSLRPVRAGSEMISGDASFIDLFPDGARDLGAQPASSAAFDVPFGPSRLTAIKSFRVGPEPYIVAGYDSGVVVAFRAGAGIQLGPVQPEAKAPFTTLHSGPILAIASQALRASSSMLFATAAADGTVVVHWLQATAPAAKALSALFLQGPGNSQSVLYGPVARRDGLMMDSGGRVLLLWDQGGGISVARLDEDERPLFRRYPLAGVQQSIPGRSVRAAQTALRDLGFYDGDQDGVVGARTLVAFATFRERAGLSWIAPDDTARLLPFLLPSNWATSAVALSPRGDLFAYTGDDGAVRIVQLPTTRTAAPSTARTIALLGHRAMVTRLAISPDGRVLASLDTTGRVLMTDLDRLLGISSLPFSTFSTSRVPEPVDPLPVDFEEVPAQQSVNPEATSEFLIVADGDRSLEAATRKVKTLQTAGFDNASVLLRNGWYRTVVSFPNVSARDEALPKIRAFKPDAYPREMPRWCRLPAEKQGFRRCQPS